ncbi:hypothetical protein KIPB_016337, partial [Kipferlia bialata]
ASGDGQIQLSKTVSYMRTSSLPHPNLALAGHKAPVLCMAWNKDGTLLATGDQSGVVLVWNVSNATGGHVVNVHELRGHRSGVLFLF